MRVTHKNRREFLERLAAGAAMLPAGVVAASPVFRRLV